MTRGLNALPSSCTGINDWMFHPWNAYSQEKWHGVLAALTWGTLFNVSLVGRHLLAPPAAAHHDPFTCQCQIPKAWTSSEMQRGKYRTADSRRICKVSGTPRGGCPQNILP